MYWYTEVFWLKILRCRLDYIFLRSCLLCLRSGYKRQALDSFETLMTT